MDLLTNAVQSIQVGVEDYELASPSRLLSAVRNIHAGILLLYKEALRRASPKGSNDVLLMDRISPFRGANGNVSFVGKGKKTVDVYQIRGRFRALGLRTNWERFEQVNKIRNEVEHLYPRIAQGTLSGLISDSFLIIRDFIAEELNEDPRQLLGEETWRAMLEVSEVHEKEKRECQKLLASATWISGALEEGVAGLTCTACGSDLLRPIGNTTTEITLQCSSCGEEQEPEFYVPEAIASALDYDAYLAAKEGGETPYVRCPACGEETYVIEERRCALCGHEAEHTCERCGNEIPPEELDSSPHCGWCEYMMNKDD
jgi:ribosomal protein L37E